MLALVRIVLGAFGGALGERLAEAYRAKLAAANDGERLAAEQRIAALEAEQAAALRAKEIRLATAGFWEMRLLTFLIALPFVIHANLVGLDTSFRLGIGIPAFPQPFDEWEGTILLSFFGFYTAGKGVAAIAGAIAARRR
jgi:hypothetical protein